MPVSPRPQSPKAAAILVAFLAAGSCATDPVGPGPAAADALPQPVPVQWDAVVVTPQARAGARLGPFDLKGLHRLRTARQDGALPGTVGGISSILSPLPGLAPGSVAFVTDQGHGGVLQLPSGVAAGAALAIGPLRDPAGRPVVTDAARDSEGLALVRQGGTALLAVSFEREHRIWLYPRAEQGWQALLAPARPGPPLAGTGGLEPNGGIEALEALPDGRLLALAEYGTDGGRGQVPFWLVDLAATAPVEPAGRVAIADGFGVTEARLLGPAVWLVLRRWTREEGTRVRLASCPLAGFLSGAPDCAVQARFEAPFPVDNFEALAIGPAPDGAGWTFQVLADDNFEPGQQTLLLELRLPGP